MASLRGSEILACITVAYALQEHADAPWLHQHQRTALFSAQAAATCRDRILEFLAWLPERLDVLHAHPNLFLSFLGRAVSNSEAWRQCLAFIESSLGRLQTVDDVWLLMDRLKSCIRREPDVDAHVAQYVSRSETPSLATAIALYSCLEKVAPLSGVGVLLRHLILTVDAALFDGLLQLLECVPELLRAVTSARESSHLHDSLVHSVGDASVAALGTENSFVSSSGSSGAKHFPSPAPAGWTHPTLTVSSFARALACGDFTAATDALHTAFDSGFGTTVYRSGGGINSEGRGGPTPHLLSTQPGAVAGSAALAFTMSSTATPAIGGVALGRSLLHYAPLALAELEREFGHPREAADALEEALRRSLASGDVGAASLIMEAQDRVSSAGRAGSEGGGSSSGFHDVSKGSAPSSWASLSHEASAALGAATSLHSIVCGERVMKLGRIHARASEVGLWRQQARVAVQRLQPDLVLQCFDVHSKCGGQGTYSSSDVPTHSSIPGVSSQQRRVPQLPDWLSVEASTSSRLGGDACGASASAETAGRSSSRTALSRSARGGDGSAATAAAAGAAAIRRQPGTTALSGPTQTDLAAHSARMRGVLGAATAGGGGRGAGNTANNNNNVANAHRRRSLDVAVLAASTSPFAAGALQQSLPVAGSASVWSSPLPLSPVEVCAIHGEALRGRAAAAQLLGAPSLAAGVQAAARMAEASAVPAPDFDTLLDDLVDSSSILVGGGAAAPVRNSTATTVAESRTPVAAMTAEAQACACAQRLFDMLSLCRAALDVGVAAAASPRSSSPPDGSAAGFTAASSSSSLHQALRLLQGNSHIIVGASSSAATDVTGNLLRALQALVAGERAANGTAAAATDAAQQQQQQQAPRWAWAEESDEFLTSGVAVSQLIDCAQSLAIQVSESRSSSCSSSCSGSDATVDASTASTERALKWATASTLIAVTLLSHAEAARGANTTAARAISTAVVHVCMHVLAVVWGGGEASGDAEELLQRFTGLAMHQLQLHLRDASLQSATTAHFLPLSALSAITPVVSRALHSTTSAFLAGLGLQLTLTCIAAARLQEDSGNGVGPDALGVATVALRRAVRRIRAYAAANEAPLFELDALARLQAAAAAATKVAAT